MRSMKVNALTILALTIALCSSVTSAWWTVKEAEVIPTPQNSSSINTIIDSQKRFVLYNSRRLAGECLEVCEPPPRSITLDPTNEPTPDPTNAPTPDPTNAPTPDPTNAPTPDPTNAPTPDPTNARTDPPTVTPVAPPVAAATSPPTAADPGCTCEEVKEGEVVLHPPKTFKCGKHVYVCPELYEHGEKILVCENTGAQNSLYYGMNADECLAMQEVEIGDKCVPLIDYGITKPNALSNRVCYHDEGYGFKVENSAGTACDECTGFLEIAIVPFPK